MVMRAFALPALISALSLVSAACAEEWAAVDQPDLKMQFNAAPTLTPENVCVGARSVDACGTSIVPNPDGKTYDVLQWYRRAYRKNTRVYIVDLATGEVKKQEFPAEEGKIRIEMGLTWWAVLAGDGKLYGANPDWSKYDSGASTVIYRYDPAINEVRRFIEILGIGGERNPMALSPNGWVYGAGTYLGKDGDREQRAAAFGFNPETGEVKFYGAIGPRTRQTAYGYSMGVCDTHIYVASGKTPWNLVAVDIRTGEEKILLKAAEGAAPTPMDIQPAYGGATCYIQTTPDNSSREYYWLYHGEAIRREKGQEPPWPKQASPRSKAAPEPEIYEGQTYPDENDRAYIWWRKDKDDQWKSVTLEGVQKHALQIHRLCNTADGRIFGATSGYLGRFLFDPKTGESINVGDQGISIYTITPYKDKIYWSGYPSGQIFVYDPMQRWTLDKGGPPDAPQPQATNPRRIGDTYDVFNKTRVKRMLGSVIASGKMFFGGKGERDYDGGSVSWLDLETNEIGGIWKPFADCTVHWVTSALDGKYVVIGARQPGGGKLYFMNAKTQELEKSVVPVPGAEKAGPTLEVAPGRLLGTTEDPQVKGGGVLYGVEVPSGQILFTKKIPHALRFAWESGNSLWDYQMGPDGFIWTFMGDYLARIDPKDVSVHVVGKLATHGRFVFNGKDMYLAGTEQVRRLANIVP